MIFFLLAMVAVLAAGPSTTVMAAPPERMVWTLPRQGTFNDGANWESYAPCPEDAAVFPPALAIGAQVNFGGNLVNDHARIGAMHFAAEKGVVAGGIRFSATTASYVKIPAGAVTKPSSCALKRTPPPPPPPTIEWGAGLGDWLFARNWRANRVPCPEETAYFPRRETGNETQTAVVGAAENVRVGRLRFSAAGGAVRGVQFAAVRSSASAASTAAANGGSSLVNFIAIPAGPLPAESQCSKDATSTAAAATTVQVTQPPQAEGAESSSSGAVAGIAAGSVFGALLVLGVVVAVLRRERIKRIVGAKPEFDTVVEEGAIDTLKRSATVLNPLYDDNHGMGQPEDFAVVGPAIEEVAAASADEQTADAAAATLQRRESTGNKRTSYIEVNPLYESEASSLANTESSFDPAAAPSSSSRRGSATSLPLPGVPSSEEGQEAAASDQSGGDPVNLTRRSTITAETNRIISRLNIDSSLFEGLNSMEQKAMLARMSLENDAVNTGDGQFKLKKELRKSADSSFDRSYSQVRRPTKFDQPVYEELPEIPPMEDM